MIYYYILIKFVSLGGLTVEKSVRPLFLKNKNKLLSNQKKHTAPGQLAGYLFQPDRALLLLATSPRTSSVSVELVDDVAITNKDGNIVYREQDKSSVKVGNTFKDRSKDLWNTLYIWIKDVEDNLLDPDTTQLICATNNILENNSLIKKIASAHSEQEVKSIILLLKTAIANPPETYKDQIEYVLSKEEILEKIIPAIYLSEGSNLENLNNEIAEALRLPEKHQTEIIQSLKGWVNENIVKALQANKPAIIRVVDFITILNKKKIKFLDVGINFLAKQYVQNNLVGNEIEQSKERLFVKQLEVMNHPELEGIIVDAIDDFLCSEIERNRLIKEGEITGDDLQEMDENNRLRWKEVFRRHIVRVTKRSSKKDLKKISFEIFDNTTSGYISRLVGFETTQYISKGSFHKLADEPNPQIGWHPEWEKLFK